MLTVEDRPRGCGAPQLLAKSHGGVEAFPSHETQRLARRRQPRYREYGRTYQRHRGNAGTHGVDSQAGTSRKGDQPKNKRATDASTSGHQPHNWSGRRYFLPFSVTLSSRQGGTFLVFEVASWEFLRYSHVVLDVVRSWPRFVVFAFSFVSLVLLSLFLLVIVVVSPVAFCASAIPCSLLGMTRCGALTRTWSGRLSSSVRHG